MRPRFFVVILVAWYLLAPAVGRSDCTCAASSPAQLEILGEAVDDRLDRGLARVRLAYPRADIRLIRSMDERRAESCLIRLRMVAAFPYKGAVGAVSGRPAEVILRAADFDDWTVYHEFAGHLLRGHVCSSSWLYVFVELWPMDLHLLLIGAF